MRLTYCQYWKRRHQPARHQCPHRADVFPCLTLTHALQDDNGEMIRYIEQDTNLWNSNLLARITTWTLTSKNTVNKYHLGGYCFIGTLLKADSIKERWGKYMCSYITVCCHCLLAIAALNRTYARATKPGETTGSHCEAEETAKQRLNHLYIYY